MQYIPIFLIGVFGTLILVVLRQANWKVLLYSLPLLGLIAFAIGTQAPDWRITVSNTASGATLFLVPLIAVVKVPKIVTDPAWARYVILLAGGLNALVFQYVGLVCSFALGVQ